MFSFLTALGGRKLIIPAIIGTAVLGLGVTLWLTMQANAKLRIENAAMKDYIATTQEIRDEIDNLPTDPDAILERLRELSQ